MSYQLYDVNGYVGDLATTTGLQELREFVEKEGDKCVRKFLRVGADLVTEDLVVGVRDLKPREVSVRETAKNLVNMIDRCEIIAIISDGVIGG